MGEDERQAARRETELERLRWCWGEFYVIRWITSYGGGRAGWVLIAHRRGGHVRDTSFTGHTAEAMRDNLLADYLAWTADRTAPRDAVPVPRRPASLLRR